MIRVIHEISADRSTLTLRVDQEAQQEMVDWRADDSREWGTRNAEVECLEFLMSNSELQWLEAADTGDLTDAPLVGICGGDDQSGYDCQGPYGAMMVGSDIGGNIYVPILERWGYHYYQLRSFMDDLADDGFATFVDQW